MAAANGVHGTPYGLYSGGAAVPGRPLGVGRESFSASRLFVCLACNQIPACTLRANLLAAQVFNLCLHRLEACATRPIDFWRECRVNQTLS